MIEPLYDLLDYLSSDSLYLRDCIFSLSVLGAIFLIGRQFEKKWPIDAKLSRSELVSDWVATGTNTALAFLAAPLTSACSVAIVTAAGGGFIHLRADGWWFAVSLLGFVVVSDLYRYASHRLSHAIPFLWALHSFHHSAEALTLVTGARHHWIERVMEGACFPILAILFNVPGEILAISGAIYFLPDGCAHLNVRFPLGRAITWLNSPQWHRIHHSVQPEHFNKNFAALLPLWDVVFGTAWIPGKDEYPATGLVPGEKCGLVTSIIWPFRHHLRRFRDVVPVWPRLEKWQEMRKLQGKVSGAPNS